MLAAVALRDDADPYSGMAQGLIQQEAAAVVAMQFPISDNAAIVFTREFYGAVADGEPLDQAMASARKALLAEHTAEWATPVLFLRAADGRVFDRAESPEPPAASPPPSAPPGPGPEQRPAPRPVIQQVPAAGVTGAPSPSLSDQDRWQPPVVPLIPPSDSEPRWHPPAPPPPVRPPTSSVVPAGPGPRRRHRGGYWIVAALVAVIVVIAAVFYLGRSHNSAANQSAANQSAGNQSSGSQPSGNPSPGSSVNGQAPASPDAVVIAFFNAITQKDWPQAWRLLGHTGQPTTTDLTGLKKGFAKTSKDYPTITSTNGNKVTVLLVAVEVDGTAQIYHASYTVSGGVITNGSASHPVDVPLGQSDFSAVSGKWLGKDRTLTIFPQGLGIANSRVGRACASNPSPPCDSVSGNQVYPGGVTVFQLKGGNGNPAQGDIVDSSVPGTSGQVTVTFQPSNDSVSMTAAGQSAPVSYCGPQAPAGLCGS